MPQETEEVSFSELKGFFDKQKRAQEAAWKNKFLLYGGAMGSGKSYWLRWMMVDFLVKWFEKYGIRNIQVGLFCETFNALRDRHLNKVETEFPDWLGKGKGKYTQHSDYGMCYILNERYGEGVIMFRNLDDPSKYKSAEFAAVAVDELTKNDKETFEELRHRMRWPDLPEKTRFIAGTNPGGIGHAWVKKKWLDGDHEPEETEKAEFEYVPARAPDNPHISDHYLENLKSMPERKRRAYLEGDWDVFKGQYFTEFRREIHVVSPFDIPLSWKRFVCLDYGYSAPSAVYWCAVSPEGQIYVYRELYQEGLTYKELTDKIVSMTGPSEDISYWVADPSIWATRGEEDTGMSGADKMKARYRSLMQDNPDKSGALHLKQGNNDRIDGWNALHDYLEPTEIKKPQSGDFEDGAKLQIFETCTNLIRTLPSLVHDENKPEDVDDEGEDHGPDAIRYGIMSQPRPSSDSQKTRQEWFEEKRDKGSAKSRSEGVTIMRGY